MCIYIYIYIYLYTDDLQPAHNELTLCVQSKSIFSQTVSAMCFSVMHH